MEFDSNEMAGSNDKDDRDDYAWTEALTPKERLNLTWALTVEYWKRRYGVDPNEQKTPRSEWPVERYELYK